MFASRHPNHKLPLFLKHNQSDLTYFLYWKFAIQCFCNSRCLRWSIGPKEISRKNVLSLTIWARKKGSPCACFLLWAFELLPCTKFNSTKICIFGELYTDLVQSLAHQFVNFFGSYANRGVRDWTLGPVIVGVCGDPLDPRKLVGKMCYL